MSHHGEIEALDQVFPGDSDLARRLRTHDWTKSSLGAPERWPEALKIPLRMMLTSRFEMWLGWGPELNFFYNDAYTPTMGAKHPTMLAKPFREVWSEVYDAVAPQVRSVMEEGRPTWDKALLLILERNGFREESYHTFSYSPLLDHGAVSGLMCVVTEETERVVSERRLASLQVLADALIGVHSVEQVCSRTLETLAENARDLPFSLFYQAGPDGTWTGRAATDEAEGLVACPWPFEQAALRDEALRIPLPAGCSAPSGPWDTPPTEVLIVRVAERGDGPPAGLLVVGINPHRRDDADFAAYAKLIGGQVSAALQNVEVLESERRRADRAWANSRDIMVVIDAGDNFQAVSPSWTRILGHQAEDVVGRSFRDFVDPDDMAPTLRALADARSGHESIAFESRFLTADGDIRWLVWSTSPEVGLVYATGRDITEEKLQAEALRGAEEALRQAQKMEAIGQLTGGVAHDFNNLLTGISGSLELLQSRAAQGRVDGMDRYISAAQGAAKRAAALTQRLLAFSRRQTLDPKPADLNRLVAGMEELVRRTVGPEVVVEVVQAGGLWTTLIDASQLDNALLNLCINARDAMPDGGRLTIETANRWLDDYAARERDLPPGQYVSLCVTDTGTGMTPEVIARAFDPFFTTKPMGSGTGLGLSMIYGFVRQSGGQVRIYSEVAQGTTMCLYLPRHVGDPAAADANPGGDGAALQASRTGRTVLVVDDEPTVRMLVNEVLAGAGHAVIEAMDGAEGLRILQTDAAIDLLITDVGLPGGLNGRQVADAARAIRPDLKVLFITGYAENAAVGNGLLERGMEVLTKPFALDDLTGKVRTMID